MRGFPAGEGVAVAGEQHGEFVLTVGVVQVYRGGEAAQQGGDDLLIAAFKLQGNAFFGLAQGEHGFGLLLYAFR